MDTKNWTSKLVYWFLACSMFLVFTSVTAKATNAASLNSNVVGGVNLEAYCDAKYDINNYFNYWAEAQPTLIEQSAGGWRCYVYTVYIEYAFDGFPTTYENDFMYDIDMSHACRMQYGESTWAVYADWNNPYSWQCVN